MGRSHGVHTSGAAPESWRVSSWPQTTQEAGFGAAVGVAAIVPRRSPSAADPPTPKEVTQN